MLFAFACTVLFSISAVAANRSIRAFGSTEANFYRLIVATVCLATLAHVAGMGLRGPAFWWFFISGCIGFGLGDIALYFALPRIGARLSVLLTQCIAAPIAAAAEWGWLGIHITTGQAVCGAVILIGVAVALAPGKLSSARRGLLIVGILAGLVSAAGQGIGAVVSRKAFDISLAAGVEIDGPSAAYQRILGGLLVTGLTLLPLRTRTPALNPAAPLQPAIRPFRNDAPATDGSSPAPPPTPGRNWPWILINAIAGPVAGVSCFQWALASSPSAVVLPIVALTPIIVIPFAWWLEGDRPGRRAIAGGVLAVIGAAALSLAG